MIFCKSILAKNQGRQAMQEIQHYIGGDYTSGTSKRTADVYNPATGEVQAKLSMANASDLDAAVERAAKAQPAWAAVNPQRRARVMNRRARTPQRRLHRQRRPGHRHVLHETAPRCHSRYHTFQLSRHDPDVDVLPGYCLRKRDDPEALRA